jgi:hypothetical protein
MPVITWTAGDILQSKVVEAGIYLCELMKYDGPKASGSGKGVNLFLTFRVTDGPNTNKEFNIALSSGMRNGSILGGMQFAPMSTFAFISAAVQGRTAPAEADGSADVDDVMHKPLKLSIGVQTEEGKLLNTINGFHPESYSSVPQF